MKDLQKGEDPENSEQSHMSRKRVVPAVLDLRDPDVGASSAPCSVECQQQALKFAGRGVSRGAELVAVAPAVPKSNTKRR